jgi:phage terminase large subunit
MQVIERRIRWYQQPFHAALVGPKYDRLFEVAHRRWGKDEMALMGLCEIANNPNCPKFRVGNYWHCFPEYEQSRKAIWEGVNAHTGKRRIDEAFPPEIVAGRDSTTMMIKFRNGSTYQLIGSDRYNATVGAGPVGIVYSEWALANPSAWAYHMPMIKENDGWAAFITTPRGNNHAKRMFDEAKASMASGGRWFAELSDVGHTGRLSQAELDEELQSYIALYGHDFGLALFEQEYHCSFSGAMVGAIFGGEINRAEREGRIGTVAINPRYPVHTAWDLGKAVNNPIWCFQVITGRPYIVDFYRPDSDDIEEWVKWLNERGYKGHDYVPQDIVAPQWGTSRTRTETMKLLGRNPRQVSIPSLQDSINAGNITIRLARFDAKRCELGLEGLKNYRREWDDELKTFREKPFKDWSEHIGSAFRHLALSWREEIMSEPKTKQTDLPTGYLPPLPMPDEGRSAGERRIKL